MKKQENRTHKRKSRIETDQDMREAVELTDKDFKLATVNMFMKLKQNINIMKRERDDMKEAKWNI